MIVYTKEARRDISVEKSLGLGACYAEEMKGKK
jgi:hypothetical protein